MKIKIKKSTLVNNGCICFLCIYFTTKLLWDIVPHVFEISSIIIISYGAFRTFTTNIHKRTFLIIIYIILNLYILLNAFIQDNMGQFQRAAYEYAFYMLIFWGTYYWESKSKIEDYASILLKIGCVICVLSWVEYVTHNYILSNSEIKYSNFTGFRTIVFSRTFLAHGIVLAFFAILGFYMYMIKRKISYLLYGIFAFVTIFSTGSRGPLVACFVGLFFMLITAEFKTKEASIKKVLFTIMGFLIIGIIWYLLTSDFQLPNDTLNYFLNRFRSILNWSSDEGNTGRIVIWNNYIKVFKDNFWFGLGPSQTGSWNVSGVYGATESGILKRLCDTGIVGTLLHYIFVFSIFIRGISSIRKNDDNNMLFYLGLFITVFIDDITLQATEEIIVSFFMWYALAGIENSKNRMKVKKEE